MEEQIKQRKGSLILVSSTGPKAKSQEPEACPLHLHSARQFGEAGAGFLRFSCAEPDERLDEALAFLPQAFSRTERVARFLHERPEFRLARPYQL